MIEAGHDVAFEAVRTDGVLYGIDWEHTCASGERRKDWLPVSTGGSRDTAGERAEWDLQSEDPLTLSPSVLCRTCGHHGFFREGLWVPA